MAAAWCFQCEVSVNHEFCNICSGISPDASPFSTCVVLFFDHTDVRRVHAFQHPFLSFEWLAARVIPSAEDHCARLSSLDYRKRSPQRTDSFRPPSRNLRRSKEAFKTGSERLVTCMAIPGNWYDSSPNKEPSWEKTRPRRRVLSGRSRRDGTGADEVGTFGCVRRGCRRERSSKKVDEGSSTSPGPSMFNAQRPTFTL